MDTESTAVYTAVPIIGMIIGMITGIGTQVRAKPKFLQVEV